MNVLDPLSPEDARRLARCLLIDGVIVYTKHAEEEMRKDHIGQIEVARSLKGTCEPPEWEGEQWRSRFHTHDVWVVVAFEEDEDAEESGQYILVVTSWRKKR